MNVSKPLIPVSKFPINGVVAADLEDYFVGDFEIYKQYAKLPLRTAVFDAARHIPYPDSHFDRMFSVSVLEHIPGNGDTLALQEMLRVLKPSGSLVITLPAFTHYVEEWSVAEHYWETVRNEKGETFFQRRYDQERLGRRMDAVDTPRVSAGAGGRDCCDEHGTP
ncbi:MAG: class I SAM-dependent methyltransferase [Akkermansiaceae bacterium]|nr:class I SAM-dependent methyltransferase [Akkermansiaceae bacterium]